VQRKEGFMFTEEKKNSQIFQDSDNFYYPEDEQQLSEVVKELYKKNLPTEIVGTGSKSFIGNKVQSANRLKLSRLSGIIEYLPEELYIKVKACTPLELIEQELDKNNQELAFEPLDFGFIEKGKSNKGTIGGYLSCNFAGPRRFKVGSVRDHILGFRGVNGKGDIIKSGGTVVKNVTGYDLSKLIAGSFGTLVALTEVTLKVLPKKNLLSTITIHTEDKKLVSRLFDKISSSSSEISGAIYIPDEPKNKNYNLNKEMIFKFNDLKYKGSFLALRLEGDKTSIDERIKELIKELELNKLNTSILDVYQSTPFWKKVNNLELFSQTKNNLVRVVIPPSNGIKLMKHLGDKYKYYIDWCGALYWIEIQSKKIKKIVEIKKIVREFGGYLTIIKTSLDYDYEESIFTVDNTRLLISEKIKKSFDPKRIFNPGKMYRGI
jgi:glycolate oxidase FAD binding subunit